MTVIQINFGSDVIADVLCDSEGEEEKGRGMRHGASEPSKKATMMAACEERVRNFGYFDIDSLYGTNGERKCRGASWHTQRLKNRLTRIHFPLLMLADVISPRFRPARF